ncbi:hypothetical protein KR009_006496, partial [Drosophila setifemur]
VPTSCNPADMLSRGVLPSELLSSSLWFHGPPFIQEPQDSWPESCLPVKMLPELKKIVLIGAAAMIDVSAGCKFVNSWERLSRVYAYIFKLCNRIRRPGLSVEDKRQGSILVLRSIQMATLSEDYRCLEGKQPVKATSAISSLDPFLDEFGLMRVGGRLGHSALDFEAQHPIILPRQHPVTRGIIMHIHRKNPHAGPLSKCIVYFKAKPWLAEHMMADLPKDRVTVTTTFMVTGLDFCGPFYYKSEVRNKAPIKTYICVFICFATKAVHLELEQDLSTSAFLSALRRF